MGANFPRYSGSVRCRQSPVHLRQEKARPAGDWAGYLTPSKGHRGVWGPNSPLGRQRSSGGLGGTDLMTSNRVDDWSVGRVRWWRSDRHHRISLWYKYLK